MQRRNPSSQMANARKPNKLLVWNQEDSEKLQSILIDASSVTRGEAFDEQSAPVTSAALWGPRKVLACSNTLGKWQSCRCSQADKVRQSFRNLFPANPCHAPQEEAAQLIQKSSGP